MAGVLYGDPVNGIYSITKQGVVALSESLAGGLTQRGAKIGVSVLLPGVVNTRITNSERNRPAEFRGSDYMPSFERIATHHPELEQAIRDAPKIWEAGTPADQSGDIVFEAIGNPATMKQGFNSLRTGGRLVAVGYSPKRWDGFDIGRVMFREMEVIGSLGCRPVDYPHIIELVKNGSLQLKPLITHKFPLTEINEAFDVMRRGEGVRILILCQK